MIEPELKPAPAGLEALGKVIALRTGKAPLTAAGEGATGIDAIMEKVAGFEAGEGLDIDATLEGVATTASAKGTAQTVSDSARFKTDAMLSASNDGSPELKLAISAKNTPLNTQTAASISVSTSMSDSAKASLGIFYPGTAVWFDSRKVGWFGDASKFLPNSARIRCLCRMQRHSRMRIAHLRQRLMGPSELR